MTRDTGRGKFNPRTGKPYKKSLVVIIKHLLDLAKYGVTGGIAGAAIAHTVPALGFPEPTSLGHLLAVLCGGLAMMLIAKAVHNV